LTKENEKLLNFLIKSENDKHEFEEHFWNGDAKQFFSVSAFRLYKINQINMNYSQFDELFKTDYKKAIEELFQQPLEIFETSIILNKINTEELTAKIIFDRFIDEGRQLNVARLVHNYKK
jgi:hypothetical protein